MTLLQLFALLCGFSQPVAGWSGVPAHPEEVTLKTLDNGVRLLAKENHGANLVAIQVWIRVGSRYETKESNGISHLLEHMIFRGSATRGGDQLKQEIEGLGGYVNAETARDSTSFTALVATEFFEPTLEALADTVLHPKLTAEDLEGEKEIISAELSARLADPTAACVDLTSAARYREHPYGMPMGGTPGSLRRIDAGQLRDFHSRFYVGPNMSVVLVGDLDAPAALAKAAEVFGAAPNRQPPEVKPPMEPPLTAPRRVSKVASVRQVVMSVAFPAPGIGTPEDVLATDVLLTALGEGATSILHKRLRGRRPLVTVFQVDYLTQKDPGLLSVTCILPRAMVNAVQAAILDAVGEFGEKSMNQKPFDRAKNVLQGQYTYQNETASGQAASMGFYEAIDTYQFALTYIDKFRAVTPQQAQTVAKRYFKPHAYVTSIVEPPPRGGGIETRLRWGPRLPARAQGLSLECGAPNLGGRTGGPG